MEKADSQKRYIMQNNISALPKAQIGMEERFIHQTACLGGENAVLSGGKKAYNFTPYGRQGKGANN